VLIRSFLITFGVQIMMLKQVDITISGVVLSVFLLTSSLGTIVGGYLNDRIGSKRVLLLFNLFLFICKNRCFFLPLRRQKNPSIGGTVYLFTPSFCACTKPAPLWDKGNINRTTRFLAGIAFHILIISIIANPCQ